MTTTLTHPTSILAVDRTKLQTSKETGLMVLAKIASRECTSPEDESAFSDFMSRAHILVQDLEAERETMVRPLIDSKSEIDTLYKEARTPWEQVRATCKSKIAAAQLARKRAQDEARRSAVAAAQAGDTQACAAALVAAPVTSKPEGAGVTWEWAAYMENANELPREFLEPSATKINAFAKQHAKSETIPAVSGIRWERRAKVSVK